MYQTRLSGLIGLLDPIARLLNGPARGPSKIGVIVVYDTQQSRIWSSTIPVACISA
jgi:hypothetical protein